MSISQLYPEEGPSLNLNFAGSRTLDPRITFTRTSSATFMGRDGLVKIAPANSARFDHRYNSTTGEVESLGLLVEEQSTNLLTGSDDFGPLYWVKLNSVGVSTNVTTSPDGTINADKFVENTDTSHKVLARSFTLTASTTYTFSIFVKSAERSNILIHVRKSDYSTRFGGFFNLITKTFTGETAAGGTLVSSSIIEYPNNWFRLTITGDIGANTAAVTTLYLCDTNNDIGYAGNGTSGIFVWGAQLEQKSFATSYIPTTTSTVTRTADNASITGSNFSDFYNPSEWTLMVGARRNYAGNFLGFPNLARINDGTNNNTIGFYGASASIQFTNFGVVSGGINYTPYVAGNIPSTSPFKMIQALKKDNSTFGVDGVLTPTDTSVEMPVGVNQLIIGGDAKWGGTIQQLVYYPTALPSNQLIALTR